MNQEALKNEYPFETKSIDINGLKYSYVDEGQGEVLLMVHGNPTWSYFYRDLIKHFSKTHRCIAVDHIGCGFSDKPQDYDYTLENHISNLNTLVGKLDLKNITLLVHDWGGAIGMGTAALNPGNFKKFVIFNTAAFRSIDIPFRINLCRIPVLGKLAVRGFNAFAGSATFMTTVTPLKKEIKENFIAPYSNWKDRIATHEFVLDIPLKSSHRSYPALCKVEEGLSNFDDSQFRILWGTHDFCFNDKFLQKWKKHKPKAEVTEFNAGHYLLEDKKDEIIPEIEKFFAK